MFPKLLTFLLLVAVMISTAACGGSPKDEIQQAFQGGAPKDEIQQALHKRLRYDQDIPIVSAKKASNPEFYPSGSDATPEEVWCIVIDTSSIPNNPPSHYMVAKRGLEYSAGFLTGDDFLRDLFPRLGCDNY